MLLANTMAKAAQAESVEGLLARPFFHVLSVRGRGEGADGSLTRLVPLTPRASAAPRPSMRKGWIASPSAAAAGCAGSRQAAPAAIPIVAVSKSRRRSRLISSEVCIVRIGLSLLRARAVCLKSIGVAI